jgi:hypothetical protein
MSISSYKDGKQHGHLGIIMTNAECFTVKTDVFLPPENLGPAATIVTGMMGVHISEMGRLHTEVILTYLTYNNVDKAFKKMIIDAFEDKYLNALSDEIVGYANCTSLQLLTHLLMYYAIIAPTELTQNYEPINTPCDTNQLIEDLFQHIQDARAFLVVGGQPYGDAMIVAAAHREFRLTNQTAQQSGFHSVNMMVEQGLGDSMQDTVDVIAQLATSTASDRGTVATLTATNAKLVSQLEAALAYVKMLKDEILALKANIKPAWQVQRLAKSKNINNYCWLNVHQVHKDHTSATYKARKDGHQEMVTKDNTMGGVALGK